MYIFQSILLQKNDQKYFKEKSTFNKDSHTNCFNSYIIDCMVYY